MPRFLFPLAHYLPPSFSSRLTPRYPLSLHHSLCRRHRSVCAFPNTHRLTQHNTTNVVTNTFVISLLLALTLGAFDWLSIQPWSNAYLPFFSILFPFHAIVKHNRISAFVSRILCWYSMFYTETSFIPRLLLRYAIDIVKRSIFRMKKLIGEIVEKRECLKKCGIFDKTIILLFLLLFVRLHDSTFLSESELSFGLWRW